MLNTKTKLVKVTLEIPVTIEIETEYREDGEYTLALDEYRDTNYYAEPFDINEYLYLADITHVELDGKLLSNIHSDEWALRPIWQRI